MSQVNFEPKICAFCRATFTPSPIVQKIFRNAPPKEGWACTACIKARKVPNFKYRKTGPVHDHLQLNLNPKLLPSTAKENHYFDQQEETAQAQ